MSRSPIAAPHLKSSTLDQHQRFDDDDYDEVERTRRLCHQQTRRLKTESRSPHRINRPQTRSSETKKEESGNHEGRMKREEHGEEEEKRERKGERIGKEVQITSLQVRVALKRVTRTQMGLFPIRRNQRRRRRERQQGGEGL